ncbi:MAG: anti-sigma factor antagonist [Candidatus Tectomicrobia bacterium]|nr:anti-sigma factor antagonist [Candidatus Tectomicrobia bacterium]
MGTNCPTIIIADDVKFNRSLIKMCLREHEYNFLEAKNGYEVLEHIRSQSVDLVILDLMMPILDGFGCLAEIKAVDQYASIPIIINSSLEDLGSVKKALAMGCYDYFLKSLPQGELQIILPLKVKNSIAAKVLLDQVSAQNRLLANEIQAAGRYQRFLLPRHVFAKGLSVRQSYHPQLEAGGDFFDFIPLSGDRTAFFIADVSGHGVLAAMVTALLKPLFERYIIETDSPAQTLTRLNEDFLRLTDDTKFVTAFVAIYDPGKQTLWYANAGHPPPLYLRRMNQSLDVLKATGTLLGLFGADEWVIAEASLPIMPYDRLLLVTDGVIEAASPSGTMFGLEGLCHVVRDSANLNLDTMTRQLWQHLEEFTETHFSDDVTFIALDFHDLHPARVIHLPSDPNLVLSTVNEMLSRLGPDCSASDVHAIRLSLAEVLMNAIEHGNLGIDSDQKQAALARDRFEELVEERQRQKPYASRLVTISYTHTAAYMSVTIRDEGLGFDWQSISSMPLAEEMPPSQGQGLRIVRSYIDYCVFHHPGNTVTLVKYFSSARAGTMVPELEKTPSPLELTTQMRKAALMKSTNTAAADVSLVALSGSINFTSRKSLGDLVNADLAQGRRHFIFDLNEVTFIDSSGLGVLVTCFTTIRKSGGHLTLIQVPEQVHNLLEITKLTDFFDLHMNAEEALQSVHP